MKSLANKIYLSIQISNLPLGPNNPKHSPSQIKLQLTDLTYRILDDTEYTTLSISKETTEDSDVIDEREAIRRGEKENSAILIENLTKTYEGQKKSAVDGLYLSIQEGECFGLLGPNGRFEIWIDRYILLARDFIEIDQIKSEDIFRYQEIDLS